MLLGLTNLNGMILPNLPRVQRLSNQPKRVRRYAAAAIVLGFSLNICHGAEAQPVSYDSAGANREETKNLERIEHIGSYKDSRDRDLAQEGERTKPEELRKSR